MVGLMGGCQSSRTGPGSDSLAAVEVQGRTPEEITAAVTAVFKGAGYQAMPVPRSNEWRLQFEKQAGSGSDILYSDWSLTPIWYRARIKVARTATGSYLVTCNVVRVNERGSLHFEEETPLSNRSRGPYQALLDEARSRLTVGVP